MDKDSVMYRSGDLFFKKDIKDFLSMYIIGSDDTIFYINRWSIIHLLSGILVNIFITRKFSNAILVHTIWELWQLFIGMTKQNTRGFIDIMIDTVMFSIGFIMTHVL